ncbi:hypothetical protein HY772_08565 [Candidatus Woesearchaeota archaeon]|nr:hypothetical protein [Candidatus Woesearchaeota archaeon]
MSAVNRGIDFFNDLSFLEPVCSGCQIKVDYGVTTVYDEKRQTHICKKCGALVK